MADPKVTVTIGAEDETKGATAAAKENLAAVSKAAKDAAKVQAQAERDAKKAADDAARAQKEAAAQSKQAWREFGTGIRQGLQMGVMIAVAAAAAIKQGFDAAYESAKRLGRTDIVSTFDETSRSIQNTFDVAMQATGTFDIMAVSLIMLENRLKLAAMAVIQIREKFALMLLDVGNGLADLYEKNFLFRLSINQIVGEFNKIPGVKIDFSQVQGLSEAEKQAQIETIKAQTATDLYMLSNEYLQSTLLQTATAQTTATKATEKSTTMAKRATTAQEEYLKAQQQKQAQVYQSLLGIAEDYQRSLKDIQNRGTEDIEDAIRNGDARALMDAKKSRAQALAQAEADKSAALKQLAFSQMDTSTKGGAQAAADFMGYGAAYNQLAAQYQAQYGAPTQTYGTNGTRTEGGNLAETRGINRQESIGRGTSTRGNQTSRESSGGPSSAKPSSSWRDAGANMQVNVYIGNEQVDGHIQTVIADKVFNANSTRRAGGDRR